MNIREWALPIYTILMQLATGTLLILWLIRTAIHRRRSAREVDQILRKPVAIVWITLLVAMLGSHFHLSNPWISFLSIVNVRNSWLSREVLFTVLFFLSTGLLVYLTWLRGGEHPRLKTLLGWLGVALGAASIFSMSNCYLLPTQAAWNHATTLLLFYCTALLLGAISAFTILVMDAIFAREREPDLAAERYHILMGSCRRLVFLTLVVMGGIVGMNAARILDYRAAPDALSQATLTLLLVVYRPLLDMRFLTLLAGAGSFALVVYWLVKKKKSLDELVTPTYVTCLLLLMTEILGRFLFYAAHVRLGV